MNSDSYTTESQAQCVDNDHTDNDQGHEGQSGSLVDKNHSLVSFTVHHMPRFGYQMRQKYLCEVLQGGNSKI
jgi:hypothetical protein